MINKYHFLVRIVKHISLAIKSFKKIYGFKGRLEMSYLCFYIDITRAM